MMEAGWSAKQVARQLGRSDCVVSRCWDQWIKEMSFTPRPGSERPRRTSFREDCRIVRNARVQPTASSAAIQAQVALSLGAPVSSRTIRMCLAEGYLGSRRPLRVLPLTHTFGVVPCKRKLDCRGMEPVPSTATNLDSISAVMTIVFVCGETVVNASILQLLPSDTPLSQLVCWSRVSLLTIHRHP
ncbi:HTH_Tnp_Tc3_2 domain-containing protein [Trichonephila clavipes]|nr:HTH_Tnp_Tc3_2 domain-containing protein [Trichonephila clavipes]